ncbi:MAG: UDP-N-acetylglucosamine 2-epimerase (non-hydrolyzing) [Bacteroidales bacterium]|nr:UDP-N-acetylglucosamine 2-epimerase (non-hydrolyzing) [Bacteroidales bacterium]
MKIVTVIGARPQIIKASAISRSLSEYFQGKTQEIIVHTGQHYDRNMSEVFFEELHIPRPKYNLNIGSGTHGIQTAGMISGLEQILLDERPDAVILYGDTNSTLAGAVAAGKIDIPIVHVEAGLRSFDKTMPEEINRILCDHVSTLLFCPTKAGYDNLKHEGFNTDISLHPTFNNPNVYLCGDIMYDNTLYFERIALAKQETKNRFPEDFILCTVHRNTNTDDKDKLTDIVKALCEVSLYRTIVIPMHPRTKKMVYSLLSEKTLDAFVNNKNIIITEPVSFLDMIYLESQASLVITDSGGVQKEAYFLKKPCIILRPQTEWTEIVETGSAFIAATNTDVIIKKAKEYLDCPPDNFPSLFGDGHAADFITKTIHSTLNG